MSVSLDYAINYKEIDEEKCYHVLHHGGDFSELSVAVGALVRSVRNATVLVIRVSAVGQLGHHELLGGGLALDKVVRHPPGLLLSVTTRATARLEMLSSPGSRLKPDLATDRT